MTITITTTMTMTMISGRPPLLLTVGLFLCLPLRLFDCNLLNHDYDDDHDDHDDLIYNDNMIRLADCTTQPGVVTT